jgi:hypothetical protein
MIVAPPDSDHHNLFRLVEWQRPQKNAVYQVENSSICPRTDRQTQKRSGRPGWLRQQGPAALADFPRQ